MEYGYLIWDVYRDTICLFSVHSQHEEIEMDPHLINALGTLVFYCVFIPILLMILMIGTTGSYGRKGNKQIKRSNGSGRTTSYYPVDSCVAEPDENYENTNYSDNWN
jgi:hypothetical protein